MPLKWNEVSEKPEFQSLTPDEKEAARLQYFDDVIKPQAQEADLDEIRSQFDADTRIEGYAPKPSEDQVKYFEDNKATNDKLALQVFSQDEIDAIKAKGKIGFVEAFKYTKWEDAAPFVGMAKTDYDLIKLNNIAQKPQDQVTEEERGEMVQYLRDQLEIDLRGVDVGGNIAFGVWQAPAFMVEFAATMGAGKAVVGAGRAALGYTVKKAVEKSVLQMGKREILKKGAEATGHALLATALNVPRITASYNEKMLNERVSVTDKGQAIFKEAETSPFTALAKTYGELAVENVSEVTGPAFGLLAKPFAPIVSKLAPYADNIPTYALSKLSPAARDALVKTYRKTVGNAYVSKMFSKGGWNGMLNELGEERVGDVMRFALDLDKEEGYSLDQLYDAAIPDKEQFLSEAGVIGILGTGRRVGNYLVNTLQEKSGMTKADAEEVVRGMTATEQDALWETMSKEERRASLNNVEERAFKQFTESGVDEAEAKAQAKNYRAMAKWGAERSGVSPEAFYENLKLSIKKDKVASEPSPDNAKAYTKELLGKLKRDKADSIARKAERPVFDGDEIVLDPILPEVSEAIGDLPKMDLANVRLGKEDTAITPTGKEIGVQFAVIEADDLIASQLSDMRSNPKYPKAMQPRDRARLASQQQISQIAASLNPRMVMDNPLSSEGAPVIGNDYVVESGNGRVLAITRAYEQHPEKAQEYVNALKASGYDVEGMKRPVLVRIRKGELSDAERVALAQESNQRTTAAMSSTEQAMTDASRIPETILGLYEGGGIELAINRPFVRAVIQSIVPQNEQGAVFTKDGELSQEAERRIGAAMLAKAYGNESILRLLTESTDNELTTLGRVLVEVSPAWAQMREAAKAGTISPAVDITGTIVDAARLILRSRREGKPLSDFFNTDDLLGDNIPTLTRELTKNLFSNNKMTRFRSFPKLSEMFRFYVEEAQKTTAGENLFGEAPVSPSEIIAQAYRKVFEDETGDLFKSGERGVGEDVSTDGGKGRQDAEGQTVSVGGEAVVRADETRYQLDYGTLWGRIVNLEGWLQNKKDYTEGQVLSMERELRKAKKELDRMEREGEALLQSAYHGSPYRFERFDLSKIGTGEGAQAYGHGIYFAENIDVAKSYSPRDEALEDALQKLYDKAEAREDYVKMEVIEEAMLNKTPQEIIDRFNDDDFSKEHKKAAKEVAAFIKKNSKGSQVYNVNIPDEDINRMLDWGMPLSEQDQSIMEAIRPLIKQLKKSFPDFDESKATGAGFYQSYAEHRGGNQETASRAMSEQGIVGIKYLDEQSRGVGEGTRNFVVFDQALLDKISDSIETLYQDMKSGAKGSVTFKDTGEKIVNLFANSDKSTFLHETGHIYLREMRRIAGMSQKATEEFEVIKKHLGSTDGSFTVAQEEQFARNFEQYFMEGIAPNKELRGVFDSFKKWLFEIYKSVRSLNGTLNNEVRDVFDQMLGGKDLDIYSMDIPLDNTETMFENFYRNMVNDLQPLENLVKKFEKLRGKLPDGLNPVMLARLGMRVKGQIIHNITKETYYLDGNGNYVSTGEGLKPILDDFDFEMARVEPDHNARYADLEEYLVAQRYTKDLMARDGVKITPRQAEESITTLARLTKKYGEEMIRFDDYAQRIYDFQARILQNLVRSGIKTQEWYDGIIKANPHYIPFQRVFDEGEIEEGFFIGGKTKYGASGEVIKELKGSEREVKDVFNSILKNTGRIIDAANRNVVALEVAAMGRVLPDYVQETEESGPRTIRYYDNGEIKKINVTEGLWLAMSNVHPAQHSVFTRLFAPIQFSATVLRVGATAMPDFWIRNFMRDQAVSRIQATAKMGQIDVVRGLMSSLGKDASYERWKAVGGGFDSYMDLSDKNIEEAYREIMNPKGKLARYLKTGGLAALQDASMVIEEGPRLAVFKAAKKAKMSDMAAALDSNDATVDFRRAGTIGRVLNRYIPFLNAGIQGVDKMIRAFQKNPALMSYRAFTTITVSQIIMTGYYLYAAPDDEREEYLEIPQWRKDIAFPIKIGDSWWYMPKPFALGYVFGSLPERFMIWSYKDGDPAGEDLWKEVMMGIGQSISPIQDIGAIMTPAGRIAVESITNYNFFTGRSIYPEWLDKLPPEEQSNKYTSETAKLLGQSLGMSPALIDNAIRGQLGGAAAYGVPVTDSIIKAVKEWNGEEFPEKPTTNADIMFLRGFSIRRPSGYNAISTQTFMKKYSEFEQYRAAYEARKDEDKAEYYEKHEDKIIAAQTLKPIREQIQAIGKSIDRIYDDKDMAAEDKVSAISELEDQMLEIAKDGNETILELVNTR